MSWRDVIDRWSLLVGDFHHLLGIDLEAVFHDRSWRWFESRVNAVMAFPESLLGRSCDKPEPAQATPNENWAAA